MEVSCYNTDCKYLNLFGVCERRSITLDDEGSCRSFEHYKNSKDYEYYYIAVEMADGRQGRALKKGKKLKISGYTFFTSDNYKLFGEQSMITEERTGVLCGSIQQLKDNFEKFKLLESKRLSCTLFPFCVYNEDVNGYIRAKEGTGNG